MVHGLWTKAGGSRFFSAAICSTSQPDLDKLLFLFGCPLICALHTHLGACKGTIQACTGTLSAINFITLLLVTHQEYKQHKDKEKERVPYLLKQG